MNHFLNHEAGDESRRDRLGSAANPNIPNLQGAWDSLGISVPTISAYAYICAHAIFDHAISDTVQRNVSNDDYQLTGPAKTILFLGKHSGSFELKVTPRGFRTTERFLALYVHINEDESFVFQDTNDLRVAIEFLSAFRELCLMGLCLHQLHGEFSLNLRGFEVAHTIQQQEVEPWLSKAQNSNAI
jgi:hypothetical protein